jgi:hypothetical protein
MAGEDRDADKDALNPTDAERKRLIEWLRSGTVDGTARTEQPGPRGTGAAASKSRPRDARQHHREVRKVLNDLRSGRLRERIQGTPPRSERPARQADTRGHESR